MLSSHCVRCIMNPWAYYKVTAHWWSQAYGCGCHGNVSHLSAFVCVFSSLMLVFLKNFPAKGYFKSVCVFVYILYTLHL